MNKLLLVALIVALCGGVSVGQEPNIPHQGLTGWALLGTNPDFGKSEELRVGYEGLLFPEVEVAVGGLHLEAPDGAVEEWSGRGYLLFHALDAEMIASVLGNGIALPNGNVYGGLFGQYTHDREKEWSGGYVVGGLVDWPKGWQTVGEYQESLWNTDTNSYAFVLGLRKEF
jgi:hypothetical protein